MCKFNSQALFKDFNKGHHHYNPVLFNLGPKKKKVSVLRETDSRLACDAQQTDSNLEEFLIRRKRV